MRVKSRSCGSRGDPKAAEDVRQARVPIASLLSKSEKAQLKVAPGTWQHTMLSANVEALRLALPLIDGTEVDAEQPDSDDVASALRALDSMIERVTTACTRFVPGTSQHSLQRNRLDALRVARSAVSRLIVR